MGGQEERGSRAPRSRQHCLSTRSNRRWSGTVARELGDCRERRLQPGRSRPRAKEGAMVADDGGEGALRARRQGYYGCHRIRGRGGPGGWVTASSFFLGSRVNRRLPGCASAGARGSRDGGHGGASCWLARPAIGRRATGLGEAPGRRGGR